MKNYEIVRFTDNEFELDVNVSPEEDTVWLTKEDIAFLFDRDRTVISKHISNIYKEKELIEESTCAKNAQVRFEGKRKIYRTINFYNLDMIISIGYRVKSARGTLFRKWANNVLKQYLIKGYVIDSNRSLITNENFLNLCNKVDDLEKKINCIHDEISFFKPNEKIVLENQIFTSYIYLNRLFKEAKYEITVIDGYLDDKIFEFFLDVKPNLSITFITHKISRFNKELLIKFMKEFNSFELIEKKNFHDRFFIIDNVAYLIGSSLNSLGNKLTFINKIHSIDGKTLIHTIMNGEWPFNLFQIKTTRHRVLLFSL